MTDTHSPYPSSPPEPALEHGQGPLELVLVKHGQRYTFRYTPGSEARVLADVVQLVGDPACELDWFDAAVLSHQIGGQMSQHLDRMLKAS